VIDPAKHLLIGPYVESQTWSKDACGEKCVCTLVSRFLATGSLDERPATADADKAAEKEN
jgi:hypothetical protein